MAEKQIKGVDIIEKDHMADARASVEGLIVVYNKLGEEIKADAKLVQNLVKSLDLSKVKGIKDLNESLSKSKTLKESSIKLEQDEAKVKQQLKQLTDEEVKAKLRLQEANKKQRDMLKDVVALENKEIGTLQKLQIENRKLTKERATLNLETEKGRKRLQDINKTLDQNNLKIRQNTDALGKQRLNIGNYQSALKGVVSGVKNFAVAMGMANITMMAAGKVVDIIKNAFNTFFNDTSSQTLLSK
jgi:chromosome segregation ATPase